MLTRSIGEMLGAAAEAFERESVAEAEAEVNAELIRRVRDMRVTAAKLETLGEEDGEGDRGSETQPAADLGGEPQSPGRAEWTEYELLRRRKALLGREVDVVTAPPDFEPVVISIIGGNDPGNERSFGRRFFSWVPSQSRRGMVEGTPATTRPARGAEVVVDRAVAEGRVHDDRRQEELIG